MASYIVTMLKNRADLNNARKHDILQAAKHELVKRKTKSKSNSNKEEIDLLINELEEYRISLIQTEGVQ